MTNTDKIINLENDKLTYGYVCMLDALGTKGLWAQVDPSVYSEQLQKLYEYLEKLLKGNVFQELPLYQIKTFSDTIIVTLNSFKQNIRNKFELDTHLELFKLSKILSDFYNEALDKGIFFRGAISHGYFYQKGNFIIGPAVDDVAEYFEIANWLGVIATPSTSLMIESMATFFPSGIEDNWFIDYEVPLKTNDILITKVLNWPLFVKKDNELSALTVDPKGWFCYQFSRYPISEKVQDKYINTIKFIDFCLDDKTNTCDNEDNK